MTLELELKCWKNALMDLTPQGSEFADDPEYCKIYVKELIHKQELKIKELIIENRELKNKR